MEWIKGLVQDEKGEFHHILLRMDHFSDAEEIHALAGQRELGIWTIERKLREGEDVAVLDAMRKVMRLESERIKAKKEDDTGEALP